MVASIVADVVVAVVVVVVEVTAGVVVVVVVVVAVVIVVVVVVVVVVVAVPSPVTFTSFSSDRLSKVLSLEISCLSLSHSGKVTGFSSDPFIHFSSGFRIDPVISGTVTLETKLSGKIGPGSGFFFNFLMTTFFRLVLFPESLLPVRPFPAGGADAGVGVVVRTLNAFPSSPLELALATMMTIFWSQRYKSFCCNVVTHKEAK
jgi:hypothetical protein